MGGQDKGLIDYQGRPLGAWVLDALLGQCGTVRISANRNLDRYRAMLSEAVDEAVGEPASAPRQHAPAPNAVFPDDPDLPPSSGPMAGILTALRHTKTEWLLIAPCDTPHLPSDLTSRLLACAEHTNADIVMPCTQTGLSEVRHHWVCGLIRKRVCPDTVRQFVNGERKVGNWVKTQKWASLSFGDTTAFANMNTLETLRGRN
jgi:molybdopterin-guanine dinucleotide biosynthesis protein A